MRQMSGETRLLSSIVSKGFSSQQALDLLSTKVLDPSLETITWGEAFKVESERIVWWNDVEKDARYSRFPKDLYALSMPSYPGQVKYIRKNIYTVVFFLDLSTRKDYDILKDIFKFVQGSVPMRFGMVPMVSKESDSASSLIAKGIYEIMDNKAGLKGIKQFIEKVCYFLYIYDVYIY